MTEMIAESAAMREALTSALDVADAPTTVLITGEPGTGKETVARFLHQHSARAAQPLVFIRGLTFSLEEATVALGHAGTVVFDDISTLSISQQAQLLTLLEREHGARVIAISARPLRPLVERGEFRSELYYRLDVFPIRVPSLRERREDLGPLARAITTRLGQAHGKGLISLTNSAVAALEVQPLSGNVRELTNILERAVIRARSTTIDANDLALTHAPSETTGVFPSGLPLDLGALEALAISEALRRVNGNRTHAARLLGIGLRTLRQKLNGPRPTAAASAEAPSLASPSPALDAPEPS